MAGPDAWLVGPEGWPVGAEAYLAGPEAWLDTQMYTSEWAEYTIHTWRISPYSDLSFVFRQPGLRPSQSSMPQASGLTDWTSGPTG